MPRRASVMRNRSKKSAKRPKTHHATRTRNGSSERRLPAIIVPRPFAVEADTAKIELAVYDGGRSSIDPAWSCS